MFNDYGLWTLYLGAGVLEWKDDSAQELSIAPLVLIPVRLVPAKDGTFRLSLAEEEDPRHNAALPIKLEQFGIDWSAVLAVDPTDLPGVLSTARSLIAAQKGWAVRERCVVALFASHKEAMYQDLHDNELQVIGNELVKAVALGPQAGVPSDRFDFIEADVRRIDDLCPPETTPLVLDADASQRQAVAAAVEGRSFVLDGPPGTGKSQTIANMVAGLMHAGRSVLFVSEKAAALDVVHNRLKSVGLDSYVLALHSHRATRKAVAEELGRSLNEQPTAPLLSELARSHAQSVRESLSAYAAAMNEARAPLGRSVHDVIGRLSALADAPVASLTPTGPSRTFRAGQLDVASFEETLHAARRMSAVWTAVSDPAFAWRGLRPDAAHPRPALEEASAALAALSESLDHYRELCVAGSPVVDRREAERLIRLLRLLAVRPDLPEWWLTAEDLAGTVEEEIAGLRPVLREANRARVRADQHVGPLWRELPSRPRSVPGEAELALRELSPVGCSISEWTQAQVASVREEFEGLASDLSEIDRLLRGVTSRSGLPMPASHEESLRVCEVLDLAHAESRPPVSWFDPQFLPVAHRAAAAFAQEELTAFFDNRDRVLRERAQAEAHLGPGWEQLPSALTAAVPPEETSLGSLQPTGLLIGSLTCKDAEQLRDRFGAQADVFEAAHRDAERAATRLGLDTPRDIPALSAICELVQIAKAPHRPLASWFDPAVFAVVRDAAETIKRVCEELRAARAAAEPYFSHAVLEASDFPELAQRLAAQRNLLGQLFSGQQRADRKRASAFTVQTTWNNELAGRLDLALAWRAKHEALRRELDAQRVHLGRYSDTVHDDATTLLSAVGAGEDLHRLAPTALAEPLRRSTMATRLADGAPADHDLLELGARLRDVVASWTWGVALTFTPVDTAGLAQLDCASIAVWLRTHAAAAEWAIALLTAVEHVRTYRGMDVGASLTVGQARAAITAVQEARAATERFQGQEVAHRKVLSDHYRGLATSPEALKGGLVTSAALDRLLLRALWNMRQSTSDSAQSVASERQAALGRYGLRESADLVSLAAALDTVDRVHALAPSTLADPHRRVLLAAQLADGGTTAPEMAREVSKLRTLLDSAAKQAEESLGLTGRAVAVLALAPTEAAQWLRAHQDPLEEASLLFRSVRRVLETDGATEAHPTLGQCREALATVAAARAAEDSLAENEQRFRALLGPLYRGSDTDQDTLYDALDWAHQIRRAFDGQRSAPLPAKAARLLHSGAPDSVPERRLAEWERLRAALCDYFTDDRAAELDDRLQQSYTSAGQALAELSGSSSGPDEWRTYQDALAVLRSRGLDSLVEHCADAGVPGERFPAAVERFVLQRWVEEQLAGDSRLRPVHATERDALVEQFRQLDRSLVASAHATVIAACNSRRPRNTTAGQAGILRRQAELKKRHMPVRELLGQARDVVRRIKPCFMMSPLTVSQFLPADFRFDVVIFDEASQVLPQDAVNCIYRGDALIVAGDQKQLPPTSFFSATEAEDEDDEDWSDDALSFESVLDACKASGVIRSLPLRWHYRSRHEDLITFSNRSFYDNSMVTFPGALEHGDDIGVAFIRADGVYDRGGRRDNRIEADIVAQRVLHHFKTRPGLSLGVVALSQAQALAIEEAVLNARASHPELDRHFSDDRLDGFFIKNLETVQGDERDVMIMSIGYGKDAQGRLRANFGPINKDGGWRRLNVAATRARCRMEVVASFDGAELADQNNPSVQHLKRFLQYAQAGPAVLETSNPNSDAEPESPFEEEVLKVLRGWGYEVQPQVGVAGYRIDLGVRHPNRPGSYALGIECDGAMYHSSRSARDRDRLRASVLQGLGWQLHRIWGTDWYRNRPQAEARLRLAVEAAVAAEDTAPSATAETTVQPVTYPAASKSPASTRTSMSVRDNEPVDGVPRGEAPVEFVPVESQEQPDWSTDYKSMSDQELVDLKEVLCTQYWATDLDLVEPGAAHALQRLVHQILVGEAPMHLEVLFARVRTAWQKGRSGRLIQDSITSAVDVLRAANLVVRQGSFIDVPARETLLARRPGAAKPRKAEHVPPAERRVALRGLVGDAPGLGNDELIRRAARFFGWARVGSDIRAALETDIEDLLRDGAFLSSAAGLTVPVQRTSPPARAVAASDTGNDTDPMLKAWRQAQEGAAPVAGRYWGLVLRGHRDAVTTLAFSPDGRTLASAASDRSVQLWDGATGEPAHALSGHRGMISALTFSPDGNIIAGADVDGEIVLWSGRSRLVQRLRGHRDSVNCLAFSPDGRSLVSGSSDASVLLWDTRTWSSTWIANNPNGEVLTITMSPVGEKFAFAGNGGSIYLTDMSGLDKIAIRTHDTATRALAFSPDGATLASGGDNGRVTLWNSVTGGRRLILEGHEDAVCSVAFSSDGTLFATGSSDQTVRLWDLASQQCLAVLTAHGDEVTSCAFSQDNSTLATASWDKTIRLWDVRAYTPQK